MIAAVSKGLLEDAANQPWLLYGLGGFVAIMLYMAGVPMLAFALGIYIPIPINMAVLAGAFVSHIVGKTGGSEKVRKARQDQGILIASGLMAGAAILAASSPPSCANLSSGRQSSTSPSARSSGLSTRRPASRSCKASPPIGTRASWGQGISLADVPGSSQSPASGWQRRAPSGISRRRRRRRRRTHSLPRRRSIGENGNRPDIAAANRSQPRPLLPDARSNHGF